MNPVQFHAAGKRKSAIARVWLTPGQGKIVVNRRSLEDYFPRSVWISLVKRPMELLGLTDQYDILANVRGGGLTGQAGAIRHAITRALIQVDAQHKQPLKKEGLVTRDARVKERKKYGRKGARRRFQYSKR